MIVETACLDRVELAEWSSNKYFYLIEKLLPSAVHL
jgi:hypothetical protein